MPCIAPARGARQTPPHTGPAFNDATDSNPCGRRVVTSVNGINVSAENLCLFHLGLKRGLELVNPPYVTAP